MSTSTEGYKYHFGEELTRDYHKYQNNSIYFYYGNYMVRFGTASMYVDVDFDSKYAQLYSFTNEDPGNGDAGKLLGKVMRNLKRKGLTVTLTAMPSPNGNRNLDQLLDLYYKAGFLCCIPKRNRSMDMMSPAIRRKPLKIEYCWQEEE